MGEASRPREVPQTSASELFEEYLDRWVQGEAPATEELERRAGAQAGELRDRLRLMRELSDLSLLLDEEPALATDELDRIGHYQILDVLGEGGLARVYLALDTQLQRKVALKVMTAAAVATDSARTWMLDEARALARVDHESVVRVRAVDEADGIAYVVMDHICGPSLFEVIQELRLDGKGETVTSTSRSLARTAASLRSTAARCRLVARLAHALDAVHHQDVIHRDVKPANVLLDEKLVPKLIDFGLARRGRGAFESLGGQDAYATLPYLAPELIKQGNHEATPASDQYSLGVLFYELLTLEHPLVRADRAATRNAVAHAQITPPRNLRPEIPVDVERICMHALERVPEERYPSLAALAGDIEAFLDHRAISLEEPGLFRRAWLTARRRPLHVALTLLLAMIACAGVSYLTFLPIQQNRMLAALELSLETALTSEHPPRDLLQFFSEVPGAREAARRFDQGLLTGALFRTRGPAVEELYRRGRDSFDERFTASFDAARKGSLPSKDDRAFEKLAAEWGQTAAFELRAAPEQRCDMAHHRLGTVALPPGARLMRYMDERFPSFPELAAVDGDAVLAPGLYRVRGEAGGLPWEIDIQGLTYTPQRTIAQREPGAERSARLVHHAGRAVPLLTSGNALPEHIAAAGESNVYLVAPLRISAEACTWRDIAATLGGDLLGATLSMGAMLRGVDRSSMDMDSPAHVNWLRAHDCVSALGVRLPTAAELWSALKSGDIEPVPGFSHEWVVGFFHSDHLLRFRLAYPQPGDPSDESPVVDSRPQDAWPPTPTAFRFVVPAR